MRTLRILYLVCDRRWDAFARRTRFRELPAVPAIVAVLALGLVIPLMASVERTPPALAETLAVERLEGFLRRDEAWSAAGAAARMNDRPWFRWPAVAGAASYRACIYSEYDLRIVDRRTSVPELRLRPPAALDPGIYRLEATPLDQSGKPMASPHTLRFTVRGPDATLLSLQAQAQLDLEKSRSALVAAGYYAEHGSPEDVWAAIEHYLDVAGPGDAGVDVARRILARRDR